MYALFETHIPVSNIGNSIDYYVSLLNFELAYRNEERGCAFLWIGDKNGGMLGLWDRDIWSRKAATKFIEKRHFAIRVELDYLEKFVLELAEKRIEYRNMLGDSNSEPSVIGWMPSAQIYLSDPDGHSVELIALLDQRADEDFGFGTLSSWRSR